MTKVTYKGVEGAEDEIVSQGVRFKTGEARDVTDEKKLAKFQGHSHFEVEGRPYLKAADARDIDEGVEDEVEEGDTYTVAELTAILREKKVTIPKKSADDAVALLALIEANGGFPEAPTA